jgi:hypothetical protein
MAQKRWLFSHVGALVERPQVWAADRAGILNRVSHLDAAAGDERNRFAGDGGPRGDPIRCLMNPLGTYEAPQFHAVSRS